MGTGGLAEEGEPPGLRGGVPEKPEDPEGFWGAWARRFHWEKPFEKVLEWTLPEHRWFLGGTTNAVYNALERNVERGLRNKVALLYLAEDGREEKLTYGELLDRVRRLATGLRRLGVGKGDRVVIYMPLTLEGVLAMLATAYIGAIHSVVYAGLGVSALRERILDAQAKLLIAGDVSFRRGKGVDLRSIAEEAIRDLPLKVVWFQRAYKAELAEGHYDFHELLWGNPPRPGRRWWTPSTPSSSSTPRAPRESPRAWSTSTGGTWWAPPTTCAPSLT